MINPEPPVSRIRRGFRAEDRYKLVVLADADPRLKNYTRELAIVNCDTATCAGCLRRVAQLAHLTFPGMWIRGYGSAQFV